MSTYIKTCTSVTALTILMTGSAAFADVSSQEVWDDWKNYMTDFGYTVEGDETASSGAVVIKDLSMSMELPDGAGSFAMTMPELSFTDNGDGTVAVAIPPVMPLMIAMNSPDAENVEMTIEYTTAGFNMAVSGDAANMMYDYAADDVSVALSNMKVDGEAIDLGTAMMSMADVAGKTSMKVGNLRSTEQSMTSGAVTYTLDVTNPDDDSRIVMKGQFAGMGFDGKGSFPTVMDASDMAAMLKAGFGFDGGFSYTGGSSSFSFTDAGTEMQGASSSDSGDLLVAMDENQLMYEGKAANMKMQVAGGEIPFPVELAMAQSGFKLKMPVSKSDTEQDFAFGITMGDFTMSDMIWGIFDPTSQLPRDPATIAMDLSGKAKLFFDIMDPTQMESIENGEMMPGEVNAVTLNSMTVRAAGAELTGSGDFTFNNADLQTFSGMPAPDGAVDLKLTGGNGLLDKLVAMGRLPEKQAMGARMMMGLFGVPGEGEDSLTSKIEVKPDGQVLANGQRVN
ncbi:MAG: DUF2125 domain-containing protein [Roseovarius sp.]|nr:DUF2125 domain-containing protein [Roseovarius sp.]